MPTYKYTVLLLYPDYLASNYGEDTYLAHVESDNPPNALCAAQREASSANQKDNAVDCDIELTDFRPLLVAAGHLDDLTTTSE